MIEAIDTFEEHFRSRVIALNPARVVAGVIDAMDWPPENVQLESFYLLSLGETPSQDAQSSVMPVYVHTLQITWLIAGADLDTTNRGFNRGNRYRVHMQMKKEVLNGLYPYFADKADVSLNQSDGSMIVTPRTNPQEQIVWSKAVFGPSSPAKDSGVITGIATVYVANMTDPIVPA